MIGPEVVGRLFVLRAAGPFQRLEDAELLLIARHARPRGGAPRPGGGAGPPRGAGRVGGGGGGGWDCRVFSPGGPAGPAPWGGGRRRRISQFTS